MRSTGGTSSPMSACESIISPPPPSPCSTRAATSCGIVCAALHASEPSGENAERDEQHVALASQVAEAPVDRHDRRGREQIRDCDPRAVAQAAEALRDRRRRGREQRLVDRRHEHRQEDRDEDVEELLARDGGRGRAAQAPRRPEGQGGS